MKRLLGFMVIILLSTTAQAELRFEALGGTCQYTKVGNYIWYNDAYAHRLDMASRCGFFGISSISPVTRTLGHGWRLGYADLGTASTDAIFPMHDSEQPLHPSGKDCDPITLHGCLGRGIGAQTAKGFSLGYVAELDFDGSIFGLEAGAFVYEGRWQVKVTSESAAFPPMNFDWRGYQATPYAGLTFRYGYLMAMARVYGRIRAAEHGCGGCSGVANGPGTQVLLGLSVPF